VVGNENFSEALGPVSDQFPLQAQLATSREELHNAKARQKDLEAQIKRIAKENKRLRKQLREGRRNTPSDASELEPPSAQRCPCAFLARGR